MNVRQYIAFVSDVAVPNKVKGFFGCFAGGSAFSERPAIAVFLLNNFNRWICNNVLFVMHAPLRWNRLLRGKQHFSANLLSQ